MGRYYLTTAWVATVYFLLGVLGHIMAIPPGVVTPVWPASGFAIAVIIIYGRKVWFGIAIGAFLTTIEPLLLNFDFTSLTFPLFFLGLAIGIGILLQAIFGVWVITHLFGKDIFKSPAIFLQFSFSIFFICVVSSSIGALSLYLSGNITAMNFIETWLTWWLGDSVGVLLIAPFILSFYLKEINFKIPFLLVILYLVLIFSTLFSFGFFFSNGNAAHALIFLSWPILLIFALKYKIFHSSLATLIISAIAVTFTYKGVGSFHISGDVNSSLLLLQVYIIATTVTTITVAILSTQQQNTKLDLLQLKENLEEEVQQRTKELVKARDEADKANQTKGIFLANMSHEIRTPLNAILGYAQLLLRDNALAESFKKPINIIKTSGDHLLALITDILDMSKIESGRMNFYVKAFKTKTMFDDINSIFKLSAKEQGIDFSISYEKEIPEYLMADEMKARQIVINLLSNAFKFTQNGFVSVDVSWTAYEILHIEDVQKGMLTIVIRDSGQGVNPSDLENIFNPFEQGNLIRENQGGTGLGLSISRQFARAMGGDITVQSEAGSTFTFSMEAQLSDIIFDKLSVEQANKRVLQLKENQDVTILVADDNRVNRILLRDMLTSVGFKVEEAKDGIEAVDMQKSMKPQMILMDVRMPRMNGIEATRAIKKSSHSMSKVIVLSASSLDEDFEAIMQAGADVFLLKPFVFEELLEQIRLLSKVEYIYEDNIEVQKDELDVSTINLTNISSKTKDDLKGILMLGDVDSSISFINTLDELDKNSKKILITKIEKFQLQETIDLLDSI